MQKRLTILFGGTVALLASVLPIACGARAQATAPTVSVSRQSLDDAWWTGPMLAPSASTLPQGHILVEPYFYDITTQGFYDSKGARRTAPHANGFGSLTYALYGLTDRFTVGVIPTGGYNQTNAGPSSSAVGMGDVSIQGQYRLHLFHEGSWLPTISTAVQETLPTGRYDNLGAHISDGLGAGTYTTTLALYSQSYFWLPNGRILRMRVNVTQSFSRSTNVGGVSVYGTTAGFRGRVTPGASSYVDAACEYSVTRHWVLALDATYRYNNDTRVAGINVLYSTQPSVALNSGSGDAVAFAPAIEYNFTRKVGVLLGTRFIAAGRSAAFTISPAIAINIVH